MGWNDYGTTPNVYRPSEVPYPGPTSVLGGTSIVTNITNTATPGGWVLVFDDFVDRVITVNVATTFADPLVPFVPHVFTLIHFTQVSTALSSSSVIRLTDTTNSSGPVFGAVVGPNTTSHFVIAVRYYPTVNYLPTLIVEETGLQVQDTGTRLVDSLNTTALDVSNAGVPGAEPFVGPRFDIRWRGQISNGGTLTINRTRAWASSLEA